MAIKNSDLKKRIIEISYKNKLSHIGSCLTALDIIEEIYQQKKLDEKFVLSSGHAGLALYVVLEKYNFVTPPDGIIYPTLPKTPQSSNAEDIFNHHGVHPDRCKQCGLDCSTGSLGQGLPVAVGMALADRTKNVYCLISDGECAEGSIWEAQNVMHRYKITNLKVYTNWNGWGAYKEILGYELPGIGKTMRTNIDDFSFLKGQDAHYYTMKEEDYKLAMEILK